MTGGIDKKHPSGSSHRAEISRLRTLHDASLSLFSCMNLGDTVDATLKTAAEWMTSKCATIELVGSSRSDWVRVFTLGGDTPFDEATVGWLSTLADRALDTRAPVVVQDVQDESCPTPRSVIACGISSAACFPLLLSTRPVAVLTVYQTNQSRFPPDAIQILTHFCGPAAVALDHAITYELQQRRVRQLSILNGIASSFAFEETVASLVDHLARSARILVGAEYALVGLTGGTPGIVGEIRSVENGSVPPISKEDAKPLLEQIIRGNRVLRHAEHSGAHRDLPAASHSDAVYNWIGVPLMGQGGPLGSVIVINKRQGSPSSDDEDILMTLAVHSSGAIERLQLHHETERLAVADGLTGLYNHREFQKQLHAEVERAKRYNREFSLLMLDIDNFKKFNDTFGHLTGDAILKDITAIIREQLRSVDLPARYGGEEFAIILPETAGEGAFLVAERIRNRIHGHDYRTKDGNRAKITASIGVATFPPDADTRDELIDAADQAMYFAKSAGRNSVCRYADTVKSRIEKEEGAIERILFDPTLASLKDLTAALDAKGRHLRGATEALRRYAGLLADAIGLPSKERETLLIACALHHIGTVGIPDSILNKPGPLTEEERRLIQQHPLHAESMLKKVSHLQAILPAIVYHHERYDGHGYPKGLKGEEIPRLARILAVAEAYHAMTTPRPYRSSLSEDEAISELKNNSGTQFDPVLIDAFLSVVLTRTDR